MKYRIKTKAVLYGTVYADISYLAQYRHDWSPFWCSDTTTIHDPFGDVTVGPAWTDDCKHAEENLARLKRGHRRVGWLI